jgi:hypothetical protein
MMMMMMMMISVSPVENSAPSTLIFIKFGIWSFFENLYRKFKFN